MKNIRKLSVLFLLIVIVIGCTEITFDRDKKATNSKGLALSDLDVVSYGTMVQKSIFGPSYLLSYGGSFQLLHSLFFDLYANYQATTTQNFLSDRYVLVSSWLNGAFNTFYSQDAWNIKYCEDFARAKGLDVEKAMMKIWKVFIYSRYTDALGPIPYSEFGNMKMEVPYDNQGTVYTKFFLELDTAVTILKANAGVTSGTFSVYDPVYAGNADKWQKLGSSLRLRLALRVKYVQPSVAKLQAEKAVSEGVITANSENAWITTTANNRNPYNIVSPWAEFRMSADMESILKGYLDPRVASYFKPAFTPDVTDDPAGVSFPYEGLRNGQTKNDRSVIDFSKYASDMAEPYTIVGDKGPNWFVIRAFEIYLLRAEGALEGWSMGGTAELLYNSGIISSLEENGYSNLNLKGETYTTSTLVPSSPGIDKTTLPWNDPPVNQAPASTIQIAYLTGGSKEQQLEQIITQKWIGLYPDSQEAYAERRRTHYPKLYDRLESENTDVPATSLPARLTYWTNEYNNNMVQVQAAITKLNAESSSPNGDNPTTKLWWDRK
jgi:hypothetical protein